MADYCVAFVTVPDKDKAKDLARKLVKSKLAACVNIVPQISSVYWWEGKIEETEELLLVLKTRAGLVPELVDFVKKNHPYKVPEVISLAIGDGNAQYLDWVGAHCKFSKPPSNFLRGTPAP